MACLTGRCVSRRAKAAAKDAAKSTNLLSPDEAKDFSSLSAVATKVRGANGQYYSVAGPLVKIKPPSGWGIHARIGAHIHFVVGSTAESTVKAIVKLYADNGVQVDPANVWFGANIDWLKQVSVKHAHTTVRDLEAMRTAEKGTVLAVGSQPYPPQVWGAKGWGILQVMLASDSYTPKRFLTVAGVLLRLLADERTGCEECHEHFTKAIEEFRKEPRDLEYARNWLYETMNANRASQGRAAFPWEHARQVNRWFTTVKIPETSEQAP